MKKWKGVDGVEGRVARVWPTRSWLMIFWKLYSPKLLEIYLQPHMLSVVCVAGNIFTGLG